MNDISNATLLAIVSLLSYIVLVKLFELSRYCNKVTSEGVHNPHEYYVSCITECQFHYWTIHFRPWYTYPPCKSDYFTCWITIVVHTDNKNHMLLILLKSNVLDNSWEPKMIVWHAVMSCCYISQMLVCPWNILNYAQKSLFIGETGNFFGTSSPNPVTVPIIELVPS